MFLIVLIEIVSSIRILSTTLVNDFGDGKYRRGLFCGYRDCDID